MQSSIAFLNAILIASSVLSSVCSLPTQSIGATLGVPITEQFSMCIETYPDSREVKKFREYAVDSEGQSCFPNSRQSFVSRLPDESDFENNYANLTAEVCPAWARTKQCFRNHLNSHKCNEENRNQVIDSKLVNTEITKIELLCNPVSAQHFRNIFKKSLTEKLWECLSGDENRELSDQCDIEIEWEGDQHRFQDLGVFFDCMKPGLRKCANGDLVREVKLVRLWEEFDQAFQDAHRTFWNY